MGNHTSDLSELAKLHRKGDQPKKPPFHTGRREKGNDTWRHWCPSPSTHGWHPNACVIQPPLPRSNHGLLSMSNALCRTHRRETSQISNEPFGSPQCGVRIVDSNAFIIRWVTDHGPWCKLHLAEVSYTRHGWENGLYDSLWCQLWKFYYPCNGVTNGLHGKVCRRRGWNKFLSCELDGYNRVLWVAFPGRMFRHFVFTLSSASFFF